jgi:hypothetical protein
MGGFLAMELGVVLPLVLLELALGEFPAMELAKVQLQLGLHRRILLLAMELAMVLLLLALGRLVVLVGLLEVVLGALQRLVVLGELQQLVLLVLAMDEFLAKVLAMVQLVQQPMGVLGLLLLVLAMDAFLEVVQPMGVLGLLLLVLAMDEFPAMELGVVALVVLLVLPHGKYHITTFSRVVHGAPDHSKRRMTLPSL